jgi:hypothetical protein
MATKADVVSYEAEIEEIMRTSTLMRVEAAAIVARRHGENVDEIVGTTGPLTDEQKRRLGLGGSLADELVAAPGRDDDAS